MTKWRAPGGHDHVTVVYDLQSGALLWAGDSRSAESLSAFPAELSQETAAGIQAVAIDMSAAFAKAVREQLPRAAIVHDRFHVMQLYGPRPPDSRSPSFRWPGNCFLFCHKSPHIPPIS